jgi:hypothetical protein
LAEQSDNQFQVVFRQSDRMILGLEPSGGVGQGNQDMAEYDNLTRYDPAWLSADGDHIVGTEPS